MSWGHVNRARAQTFRQSVARDSFSGEGTVSEVEKRIWARGEYGFLTAQDLKDLAAADRLRLVLVRCGGGRFVWTAQDAAHFVGIIAASGKDWKADGQRIITGARDYVRDVSLWNRETAS